MKARLLVALAAGLMVGSDPAPDFGEVQSQAIPPGSRWVWSAAGYTFIDEFGKDGMRRTYNPKMVELGLTWEYTLNPTASPPRLDTKHGLDPWRGIYRLEGDRLLICMSQQARPATFAHRPGVGQHLHVYKRLK